MSAFLNIEIGDIKYVLLICLKKIKTDFFGGPSLEPSSFSLGWWCGSSLQKIYFPGLNCFFTVLTQMFFEYLCSTKQ